MRDRLRATDTPHLISRRLARVPIPIDEQAGVRPVTEQHSDKRMLEELARGDVRALGDLYDVHARRVYHVLLAHAVDEHVAEDALQEAFLSLVDRRRAVLRIRNLQAYLIRTARNIAGRVGRRGRREEEHRATAAANVAPTAHETISTVWDAT